MRVRATGAVVLLATPLLAGPLAALEYRAGELTIDHLWARASAGAQANDAAYAVIRNGGAAPDRLLAARSAAARAVELHTHSVTPEGVAQVRPVDAIEDPPAGEAMLAPGGLHIMLIRLAAPLKTGVGFPKTLVFERAGEVTVEVAVESGRAGGGGGQGHAGH